MSRRERILAAVLASMGSGGAAADAVTDICRASDQPALICACAAERLRDQVGPDDYRLYRLVGRAYLDNRDAGMAMSDAWDSAVKAAADAQGASFIPTLGRSNEIGSAHRQAMQACADR